MSNTNLRILDGMEYNNNISINIGCDGIGGSLETEDTIFSDKFLSYTLNTPISLANSLFNQDGSVIITSYNPVNSCNSTSASLTVNGGFLVKQNSVISGILRICNTTSSTNICNGSLIISGGASIYQNLNINGILSIFNTTPSTSSTGSIITLGGITIQNTVNSTDINNGGSLTILGGASILKDLYTSNIYNYSMNSSNGNFGNISSSTLYVSNANIINSTFNSLTSTNSTLGNANVINLSNTNSSIVNLSVNYSTFGSILTTNEYANNSTILNLVSNYGNITNINSSFGNINNLTVSNLYVTNNIEYNDIVTNLSTANIISSFSSIGSVQIDIGTFGSLYGKQGSFLYSDTISTSNLLSISIIAINISTSNLTASTVNITQATINNLLVNNQIITNLCSSNAIMINNTVNNLYANYGTINYFKSTNSTINTLYINGTSENSLTILYGGININTTTDVTSLSSGGGITNYGGASIAKSLIVGNTISSSVVSSGNIYSISNTNINNISIYSTIGQLLITSTIPSLNSSYGSIVSLGGISISNTADVTSISSGGGLTDAGGASIAKSLLVGGTISTLLVLSSSANIYNLSSNNLTSVNSILTNSSILNLIAYSQTVSNLYATNSSISNLNIGYLTSNFIISTSANISNLSFLSGTFGTLSGNYLSANYITNNVSLTSQNATVSTLNSSNSSFGNVQITNGTFNNLMGNQIDSYTGSIGTLISINASLGNLYNINSTTVNQLSTNISSSNIIGNNLNFIYSTIGNLLSTNIITSNLTIGNLNVNSSSISNLNVNYESIGNSYIISLVNTDGFITNSTIQNIKNIYISSSLGSFVSVSSDTAIIDKLINTNVLTTNITSNNINTNNIYSTNGILVNSSLSNTYITNSTISNIYNNSFSSNYSTISNLYSSNGNFTNITSVNIISTNNTSVNLLSTNTTLYNILSTNETVTTLNVNQATFGNINFTGNLYQNGLPYVASQWTTVNTNNIIFTRGNVGIGTSNPSSTLDVIGTAHFSSNVNFDGNISSSNIYASNLSVGNINNALSINSQLVSSINFYSTNSTTTNLIATNSTINAGIFNSSTISNLNSINLASNIINVNGIVPSYNSTTGTVILQNGGISINCTVNSISITSGGAATLAGGLSVLKDVYIGGNTYIVGNTILYSQLDLNKNVINNVTSPSFDLQAANKWYVDNRFTNFTVGNVNGNFTQGQVIVATTGGNITGFNNFTFDGITLTLNSTLNSTSLTNGGALQIYGGASIDLNLFVGNNAHILGYLDMNNQKIMSVAIPTTPYDAANKYYVDNKISQFTIGNVSGNFTQGQVIVATTGGNITGFSNFTFDGNLLSLTSTNNSLGIGSGGTLTVNGGSSFLGNVYMANNLDLNNKLITNVTAPNSDLQVANKWYVDNRLNNYTVGNVSGNFTQGQVIIATTGGNITGFSNFIFDGSLLSLTSTNNSLGIGSGGTLTVNGGASFLRNVYMASNLDLNNQLITNVTAPNSNLQVANKWYVDNRFSQFTIGNVSGNFTQGQVIVATTGGNITGFSNFIFDGSLLSLTSTNNSLGIGSGGTLTVNGGASFLGNVYMASNLDLNNKLITNVTAPNSDLQVANKWYVDNRLNNYTVGNVNGNFTQGQVIIAGTNGNITGFRNLLFDGNLLSLNSTINSLGIGSGGTLNIAGGASILGNVYLGGILNVEGNQITNVPIPTNQLDAVNKEYVDFFLGIGTGDIPNTSVLLNNNVNMFTDINLFSFSNTDVSSFVSYAYLQIPELNIYGQFELRGLIKNTIWELNTSFIGDYFNGLSFNISNINGRGHIQYKNKNLSGNALLSFRAITTNYGAYINITRGSSITGVIGGGTGQSFFTNGTLLFGNGVNSINTDINLLFNNNVLYLSNTSPSTGLTSGGVLQINGGVNINQNMFIGNGLDLNSKLITNVTAPSLDLDAANKWYVDNRFSNYTIGSVNGNFTQGQVIVATTGGNITGFQNFLFDGNLLSLNSTINSLGVGSGGTLNIAGGASILGNVYLGGILNVEGNQITNVPIPINQLDAVNKEYVDFFLGIGTGDIPNTSVLLNNNVNMFTDINLFSFSNTDVSSFVSYAYLQIPELNIYGQFELRGLIKNTIWELNTSFIGDYFNGLSFNISNINGRGHIQYKNKNISGNALLSFRAITTNHGTYINITTGSLVRSVVGGGTGQPFFTNGTLLFGNGVNPINTDINLLFNNNVLYLSNTSPSTGLTSGGVLQINGGVNINQNMFIGNGLDLNSKLITNVTAPSLDLDAANKWYVDSKFGSSTGSLFLGGTILFSNTTNSTNASTGGTFTDMGGAGIAKDLYIGGSLYVDNVNMTPNLDDIFSQRTFNALNDQATPINVPEFVFRNTTRYFTAWVYVSIIATNNISAGFTLEGINLNSNWQINSKFIGKNTYVNFTCVNGQIKYSSSNISGFISSTISYRALTIT